MMQPSRTNGVVNFDSRRHYAKQRRQQTLVLIVGTATVLITALQVGLLVRSSAPSPSTAVQQLQSRGGDGPATTASTHSRSSSMLLESRIDWPTATFADHRPDHRYAYPGDTLRSSPTCQAPDRTREKVCARRASKHRCFDHVPETMPAPLAPYSRTTHQQDASSSTAAPCQTLWFSGFDEGTVSQCPEHGGRGIRLEYAAALASAREHARGVLQPVLLLSRSGATANETAGALRTWALEQGAIVITVERLSFHDEVLRWNKGDGRVGPYLRLDIPQIIEQHGLLDRPGICPQHVLYTDADVMFVNPISHSDMDSLKSYLVHRQTTEHRWWKRPLSWPSWRQPDPPMVLYGREWHMRHRTPVNTGVMLMDVPAFREEFPHMIAFRNQSPDPTQFYAFDQGWMNSYFSQNKVMKAKRHLLPLYWNWKLYWRLDPSVYSSLKLVHFHGPKPAVGAREMAACNVHHVDDIPMDYRALIEDATCCDEGRTASRVLRFFDRIVPTSDEIC